VKARRAGNLRTRLGQWSDEPCCVLDRFVDDVAAAFTKADGYRPVWTSRTGRQYQAGIGPHGEDAAVALMLTELRRIAPYESVTCGQFVPYPDAPRQRCDIWLGHPTEWAIEVKMARFKGDNGKQDDTALKDLLSPYESDRSALTDTVKLARSGFPSRMAMLIYGFEFDDRPLEPVIAAFEILARERVKLGRRHRGPWVPLCTLCTRKGSCSVGRSAASETSRGGALGWLTNGVSCRRSMCSTGSANSARTTTSTLSPSTGRGVIIRGR
jgi:hypothetical protein